MDGFGRGGICLVEQRLLHGFWCIWVEVLLLEMRFVRPDKFLFAESLGRLCAGL
jgi:hypothetical protein